MSGYNHSEWVGMLRFRHMDVIKDDPRVVKAPEEVVKEAENVVKAKTNVTKEFVKAYSGDIRSLFWLLSLPSLPNQRYNV